MINFNHLSPDVNKCQQASTIQYAKYIQTLWQQFHQRPIAKLQIILEKISPPPWQNFYHRWQLIQNNTKDEAQDEQILTDWLIHLFDLLFNHMYFDQIPTVLVRGESEPEYFPSEHNAPARIEFAHGFFKVHYMKLATGASQDKLVASSMTLVTGMNPMVEMNKLSGYLSKLKSSHKPLKLY